MSGELNPVSCATQNVVSAPVSTSNGLPNYSRMRAVTVSQGQCATIEWQLHDNQGHPVSLTACASPDYRVVLRLKEQLSVGNAKAPVEVDATITAAAQGRVQAERQLSNTACRGSARGRQIFLVA
jgi:hypothetical protein